MTEETYGLADYSEHQPVVSIDPVCGCEVVEQDAAGKIGYWGQMYYFCSPECLHEFQEYPERFAGRQR